MRFTIFPLITIVFYAFGLSSLASGRTIRLKKLVEPPELSFNLQRYEYYNQTQQKFRQYNTTMKQLAQFVARRVGMEENRIMFYYFSIYPRPGGGLPDGLTAFPRTHRLRNGTYVYGSTEGEYPMMNDPFLLNYGNQLFNETMIERTIEKNENVLWWCDTDDCLKDDGRLVKYWYPKIGEAENYPDSIPESGGRAGLGAAPPMCRSWKQNAAWSDHQYCEERGCTDTITDNNETFPCLDVEDPFLCIMGGAHDFFTPGIPQPSRCSPSTVSPSPSPVSSPSSSPSSCRKCVSSYFAPVTDAWCQEVECDPVYVDARKCKWVEC